MKILMVNDYQEYIGGTETYMYSIIAGLEKLGHEVSIFSSDVSSQEYFSPLYNRSFLKYVKRIFNPDSLRRFRQVVRDFQPDIVHIHNIYNEITPSILSSLPHPAIVMTVHGSHMVSPVSIQTERTGHPCRVSVCEGCFNCIGWKGTFYEFFKRSVYRRLLKRVTLYITPSDYLRSVLEEKHYGPVERIYNGIQLFPYAQLPTTKKLLYVGRITTEKGIDTLLSAFSIVVKKLPEVTLTIVGNGHRKSDIKKVVSRLSLEDKVFFAESINSAGIYDFYRDASVVLIPSIYPDNLPTVGLEALSVGRPLIGSAIGGIPEIIRHQETGFLVKPGDAEDLAFASLSLLQDDALMKTMSKKARAYAEETFAIHTHIDQLLSVYKRILR